MFQLKFSTENASFETAEANEIARVLYEIAEQMAEHDTGSFSSTIADTNGNTIGRLGFRAEHSWKVTL